MDYLCMDWNFCLYISLRGWVSLGSWDARIMVDWNPVKQTWMKRKKEKRRSVSKDGISWKEREIEKEKEYKMMQGMEKIHLYTLLYSL